jgi:site-specific recombinase XerC
MEVSYAGCRVSRGLTTSRKTSVATTITGLKFFFEVTLDRGDLMAKMQPVRVAQTLPVVLSRPEVARLIAAASNLKSQTALSIAYGAGLRASEVIALKVGVGLSLLDFGGLRPTRSSRSAARARRRASLVIFRSSVSVMDAA